MKFVNDKKAQITLFIIIGIIVLLGVGVYLYMGGIQRTGQIPSEAIIEEVPLQFQPVRAFVDSCLIKTSTEALTKIGQHGGYIYLLDNDIKSNSAPTESNAFRFFPEDENTEVPYWWYF